MNIFADLARGIVAPTEADTRRVAAGIAADLPADRTLALAGDLGAGKTTFVKGLAAAWGVAEAITSPSYTLCNLHRGMRLLVHVDAYRLARPEDWDALMIEDFLATPWCLAVEWPERVRDRISRDALWLRFEMRADGSRVIRSITP